MEEIDLKELFEIFWTKKIQILLVVIIFMVMGVVYTMGFTTPKYSSSTTLVLAMAGTKESDNLNIIKILKITVILFANAANEALSKICTLDI